MKLVEVNAVREFANTFLGDPILKMAVNAVLENVPAFEQQTWISVMDRLPEHKSRIIVADNTSSHLPRIVRTNALVLEEFWGTPVGYFAHGQKVTHWMPLPELPDEETYD